MASGAPQATPLARLARTLQSFVDSGHPLLGLTTREEARALRLVAHVAKRAARPVVGVSTGAAATPAEVAAALSRAGADGAKGSVVTLVGFEGHLSDPVVARALRDALGRWEAHGQTAVVVGPVVPWPDGVAGDGVRLELPLPGSPELDALLGRELDAAALEVDDELRRRAVRAVQGLGHDAARRALRRATRAADGLRVGSVDGLLHEKRALIAQADLLEHVDAPPSLEAVGGLGELKRWLADREAAFGDAARAFGLPTPKGLLLVGVQGCGKSLSAKAVAHHWRLPLVRLDFGSLFTHAHSPEENLRRGLRLSEALAPVVLWVDEIDKAFAGVARSDGAALSRVFATFLTWLQEKTEPVFVVATANNVDHLPPELSRKGRFDEIFFVDLPTPTEREAILAVHLRAHGRNPDAFALDVHARAADHLTGAELEQVVVGGLYRAFHKRRELKDEDLEVAARGIVPLWRTYEEPIKRLREWAKVRARKASLDGRIQDLWGQ